MRHLYKFELYKDFFIKDLNNSIFFENAIERDNFFNNMTNTEKIKFEKNFNFITDRQSIKVQYDYQEISKCTYGKFYNANEIYYFNIITTQYVNDGVTEVNFIIDPFVTFATGDFHFSTAFNTQIDRQHLSLAEYNSNIRYLTHNDDILFSASNDYSILQKLYRFDNETNWYYVLIQSAVDLSGGKSSFGTVDAPLMPSAFGGTFNKITSPVSLYIMRQDDFAKMTKDLQQYSWIVQNFIKVTQIPANFILDTPLTQLTAFSSYTVYQFQNNSVSKNYDIKELCYTWAELANIFGCDLTREKHLMRYPYCYIEMQTWDGQKCTIKLEDIENTDGLVIKCRVCVGYHNQVVIYADKLNQINENASGNVGVGDFMNNAIIIDNFDDVPVLIDNYNLGLAKSAYQRELTESKLISNRVKNIVSGDDIQSRLFDTISVISNFSPMALGEKITDEYEYYRTKNAEIQDSKLTTPTITNQTHSNNFQQKEEIFGITMKFRKVAPEIFESVRQYHNNFGFSIPFLRNGIKVNTMSRANYLKAKLHNFKMSDVDSKISDIFKLRIENGIRLWNQPVSGQDLTKNMIK